MEAAHGKDAVHIVRLGSIGGLSEQVARKPRITGTAPVRRNAEPFATTAADVEKNGVRDIFSKSKCV